MNLKSEGSSKLVYKRNIYIILSALKVVSLYNELFLPAKLVRKVAHLKELPARESQTKVTNNGKSCRRVSMSMGALIIWQSGEQC